MKQAARAADPRDEQEHGSQARLTSAKQSSPRGQNQSETEAKEGEKVFWEGKDCQADQLSRWKVSFDIQPVWEYAKEYFSGNGG